MSKTVYDFVYNCPNCGKYTPVRYLAPSGVTIVQISCKRCHKYILEIESTDECFSNFMAYKVLDLHKREYILGDDSRFENRDAFWCWVVSNFGKREEKNV